MPISLTIMSGRSALNIAIASRPDAATATFAPHRSNTYLISSRASGSSSTANTEMPTNDGKLSPRPGVNALWLPTRIIGGLHSHQREFNAKRSPLPLAGAAGANVSSVQFDQALDDR